MVIMYPAAKDKAYHKAIKQQINDTDPLTGPIIAHLDFYIQPPKTINKKVNYPRGDIDNYVKAIFDAVQGEDGLMLNDKQVVKMHASKNYATDTEPPGVRIELYEKG